MTWGQVAQARRRLAREQGFLVKGWGGRIPIALVYPNSYYLGMSSLGFQSIYRLFNAFDPVVCERAFYSGASPSGERASLGPPGADGEWAGDGQRRRYPEAETAGPPLSLESQRPLADFAVVAFSLSYEMDYFNLVGALKRSGIPLLAAQRDERHPLVIAGGPCMTANPEPLAPFLDAAVLGEGEMVVPALARALEESRGYPRQQVLELLAQVPGIYVPALGRGAARQWLKDLDSYPATSVVLTPDTSLGDMYLMEVTRGCPWGCRFCLAGFIFRPLRSRSLPALLETAREGLRHRRRLGLVGAAVSDYPWIDELVGRLREMGAQLSASSLRLRPLSEGLVRALVETGAHTLTFAPEAGSERLRDFIGKGVSQEDIFRGIELAARWRLPRLKLYFMVGLPSEEEADIQALIDLCLACRARLEADSPATEMVVSLTPFVPKAMTPFQWEAMAPVPLLEERLKRVQRALRRARIRLRYESPEWCAVQGVLARGDRRLAQVLALMGEASPSNGRAGLPSWQRALQAAAIDSQAYLGGFLVQAPLPWSHLDPALPPGLLGRQHGQALESAAPGAICSLARS